MSHICQEYLTLGQRWLKRTHLNLQQNSTCGYIKLFSQQYNEQVTDTRENGMRDTQTIITKKQQSVTKFCISDASTTPLSQPLLLTTFQSTGN